MPIQLTGDNYSQKPKQNKKKLKLKKKMAPSWELQVIFKVKLCIWRQIKGQIWA